MISCALCILVLNTCYSKGITQGILEKKRKKEKKPRVIGHSFDLLLVFHDEVYGLLNYPAMNPKVIYSEFES